MKKYYDTAVCRPSSDQLVGWTLEDEVNYERAVREHWEEVKKEAERRRENPVPMVLRKYDRYDPIQLTDKRKKSRS